MRLLLEDLLRRKYRWPTALFVVPLVGFWAHAQFEAEGAPAAFTMSLAVAFMLGPFSIASMFAPRAIDYLPVSRRDVWRATWLAATVVPAVLAMASKSLTLLVPGGTLGFSRLLLSSVYDFAYAGMGCGLVIVAARSHPARGLRRRLSVLISAITVVPVVGGPFWVFAIQHQLPTHWSGLSPVTGAMLAGALAVSMATYFHTPGTFTRGGHLLMTRAARQAPRARQPGGSRVGRRAGLTGLARLLVHEYAWSAAFGGFLVATFGVIVFVTGALMNSPASHGGFLEMQSLLLFDDVVAQQRGQLFDLLIWCGLFSATLVGRFPEVIRHLRVLPIRASRLNLLFVVWPFLMLLTVWVALLGLHYAVLGQPVASLQPALLVALAGSSALVRALSLRWPRYSPFVFGLTFSVVPMVRLVNGPSSAALTILGLGGIAAAAALNHFTLMRSSTYQRPPQGFGVVTAER